MRVPLVTKHRRTSDLPRTVTRALGENAPKFLLLSRRGLLHGEGLALLSLIRSSYRHQLQQRALDRDCR